MKRIKVSFAGLEVEFTDRNRAINQIRRFAEEGTFPVYVVYGPEGCGKTALLKQAKAILEDDYGYYVIYVNPLAGRASEILAYTPTIKDIVKEALRLFPDPYSRIVDVAISTASQVLKKLSKTRLAILMDDVFQAVGLNEAESYVKTLLNLIEWPPASYERIVVLVASSEGVTQERIGRHRWTDIFMLWNMPRDGFQELYGKLPKQEMDFNDVWVQVGGNPGYLEKLYRAEWGVEKVVEDLVEDRRLMELIRSLPDTEKQVLKLAVEDPDVLLERYGEAVNLVRKLIEENLIVRLKRRDPSAWIDEPPPEKDPELGIGRYYAWQTPLHREAVKRALDRLQL